MTTDTTTDPELVRLLDAVIDGAMHTMAIAMHYGPTASPGIADVSEAASAQPRAALLDYIAARYVRRPPVPPLLPTPADVDAGKCRWTEHGWEWTDYRAARGILPWKPGDELPEERIRRMRDGDRQHTLHLDDDAGVVAGGAPDFEGER